MLYCTVLHCNVLYCTVVYFTVYCTRDQEDREQALDDLRSGEVKILIATGMKGLCFNVKDMCIYNIDISI